MRKIKLNAVFIFIFLFSIIGLAAFSSSYIPYRYYKGYPVVFVFLGFLLFYLYAFLVYRLFLSFFPLKEGYIKPGSKQEMIYQVYLLFYLILFYQLIRPKIIPVPILKIVYLLLGAKLGKNTFCSGTILDPIFTVAGDNTIIGEDSCLFAHAIEGPHLSHKRIILGNNVTIGAKSILMSGVEVGNGSIIAAGSVVPKNTIIKKNEIWGGNPAGFIKPVQQDFFR
jgi:acetyltransferase-like isoleucine patch superfamily enzyme